MSLLLDRYVPAILRLHPNPRYSDPEVVKAWLTALARRAEQGASSTDIFLHELWRLAPARTVRAVHVFVALAVYSVVVSMLGLVIVGPPAEWVSNIRR